MSRVHRFDEDDVRVRPNRRKARPRSKERPQHTSAVTAMVVAVDRGRYTCVVADAPDTVPDTVPVTAMTARELGRTRVVVGDRVGLVGDLSGGPDALARIVRLEPRSTTLRRSAEEYGEFSEPNVSTERIIVANADQLAIVSATTSPQPRPGLIDRCLVAAYDAGMSPLLLITKTDLASPADLLALYEPLELPMFTHTFTHTRGEDLTEFAQQLAGHSTVLVGHSGVGKSTLVNALVPQADRLTSYVNQVTGRGRHTSSSAVAFALPTSADSWIIDTPGVRSFGITHVTAQRIIEAFPDLAEGAAHCPRGCAHTDPATDSECALDDWIATGHSHAARLSSLRRLLTSRAVGSP